MRDIAFGFVILPQIFIVWPGRGKLKSAITALFNLKFLVRYGVVLTNQEGLDICRAADEALVYFFHKIYD
jgi:hypothetical protein